MFTDAGSSRREPERRAEASAGTTEESRRLVDLARRIAEPYAALPTARAGMVTGSAAKGLADEYSDVDMTLYYEGELPPEEDLVRIREAHGAPVRRWTIGDHAAGSFAEAYLLDGVEVQIGHTTIEIWEATIASVMVELETDTPAQKALEGTLACRALFGDELLDAWKERIAAYPDALARAMVEKNLQVFAVWGLEHQFRTRDAGLWLQEVLVESAYKLLGVLAGLNHLYFSTFQFKRTGRFVRSMRIAPPDLEARLGTLFEGGVASRVRGLQALVVDVLDLVDEHMPGVDTAPARKRIGWRQEPWAR